MLSSIIKHLKLLPGLFWVSGIFVLICFCIATFSHERFINIVENLNNIIFDQFGNFYLWLVLISFMILLSIGLSPLGKIRLGGKDAKPTHSFFSWFAMIFCAGMGIGILFWGGAEPLFHFINVPFSGPETSLEKQLNAMHVTFFHWSLSPWGIYGLTTIAIGFWGFNLKKGFYLSAPLNDDKSNSTFNTIKSVILKPIINFICLITILFGIAASFGLGVLHLEGGMNNLFNLDENLSSFLHFDSTYLIRIMIIIVITIIFMYSSLRGLDKGIKVISNVSIYISIFLLISIFILSPCLDLILPIIKSIPAYIAKFPKLSLGLMDYAEKDWMNLWTLAFWAWWIAWSPFVGTFIALISKGRTLREIMLGVLLVPSLFVFIWFVIFGNATITLQIAETLFDKSFSHSDVNTVLFILLNKISNSHILSYISLILIAGFFINSADSATYTLAALSNEDFETKPPKILQIGWGLMFACLSGIFLLTGGLKILLKTTLISVLPFSIWVSIAFTILIFDLIKYYKNVESPDAKEKQIKIPHKPLTPIKELAD